MSRSYLFSYSKDAVLPIFLRHYKHVHDNPIDLQGFRQQGRDWYTLFLFVNANIHFLLGDNTYAPSCGDIVTLRKEESYTVFYHDFSEVDYYEINFPPEFFERTGEDCPFRSYFFDRALNTDNHFSLSGSDTAEVFRLLQLADSQIRQNDKYLDYLLYAELTRIGILLSHAYASRQEPLPGKIHPVLKETLLYLTEHCTSIQSITEIAGHCHISPQYLARLFQKTLNTTPQDYLNTQKLAHAKYLLKNGADVTEACYSSGFRNYNYFITTFKKHVGQTPARFQKDG